MPDRGARAAGLVAGCLALAALSLLLPWALAFDPWAWVGWGREVGRLELDTAGGPSWKPLPVVATTVLAAAGDAAPALWLVLARAGGLLALAGAAALAHRLAGSALAAALAMALSGWWFFNTALGNSEGLLVAAALWAVVAHLDGRRGAALALLLAASLLRPEAWPFLGLYALHLWRARSVSPAVLVLALAPVPLLWFGPDVLGAGGALGASDAARGTASPQSAVYADVPALEVLADFAELVTLPVLALAAAGVARGARPARLIAGGALGWVALVAAMTQAGYAGNPRYNVVPAAFACVLAGVGVAALARSAPARAGLTAALAAATLAFTAGDLADQAGELGDRAGRRTQLDALVDRAGGAAAIRACAAPRTNQPMKAMLAWRLDVPMEHLADRPVPPATVFAAPPGYAGEPPLPAAPGFAEVAREGEWTLRAACAGGRRLTAGPAPAVQMPRRVSSDIGPQSRPAGRGARERRGVEGGAHLRGRPGAGHAERRRHPAHGAAAGRGRPG